MLSLLDLTLLSHFVWGMPVPTWFWWLAGLAELSNNLSNNRKLKALERIAKAWGAKK